MSPTARRTLFAIAAALLVASMVPALSHLPPVGVGHSPMGYFVSATVVDERHSTDAVTSVTFDQRGFDTMGEEMILFTSVIGVTLLLRRLRGEYRGAPGGDTGSGDEAPERHGPPTSEAVRLVGLGLVGALVVLGLETVTHGQVSPGGGFQGGVVLATAPLVVYLTGGPARFERIAPRGLVEVGEAVGMAGYVFVGLAGLAAGAAFLENVVPLGTPGGVLASGTILLLNLATGLEVAAGIVLVSVAFLEEALQTSPRRRRRL